MSSNQTQSDHSDSTALVEAVANFGLDAFLGDGPNPFEQYAAEEGVQSNVFLRHSGKSGEWSKTGNERIEPGTTFAMLIMDAEAGWMGWKGGKPLDQKYVMIRSREPRIKQSDLTPIEKETSSDGWQEVIRIPVRDLDGGPQLMLTEKAEASYRPIKKLVAEFGANVRQHYDRKTGKFKIPLVEVSTSKVVGKKGTFYTPVFKIVEWVTEEYLLDVAGSEGEVEAAAPAPAPAPEPVRTAPPAPATPPRGRRL